MKDQILNLNKKNIQHTDAFDYLSNRLSKENVNIESILTKIEDFQVAIPSWALGAGGTRFGRFGYGGEPSTLEEKIDDVGVLHLLTGSAGAISLHIPWDIPSDATAIKQRAESLNIVFDAVNSNTFQDQKKCRRKL